MIVTQRGDDALKFFVFAAVPSSILAWSRVDRTADSPGGAQRMISGAHLQAIKKYIKASPTNVIPTSVTLSLPQDSYTTEAWDVQEVALEHGVSFGTITIATDDCPGYVLDGQHRLIGLDGDTVPLVATLILGADRVERAVHFVVINNKAKRVPLDLVKAITSEMNQAEQGKFHSRLESARLSLGSYATALAILSKDEESPFFQLVDWDTNRDGERIVKPAALEGGVRVIRRLLGSAADVDEALEIFMAMWRGVRSHARSHEPSWGNKESKLHMKAVVIALTEHLVDILAYQIDEGRDVTDLDWVEKFCRERFAQIPWAFWTTAWGRKGLDTSAGRELIREAIRVVRRASNRGDEDPMEEVQWFFNPE